MAQPHFPGTGDEDASSRLVSASPDEQADSLRGTHRQVLRVLGAFTVGFMVAAAAFNRSGENESHTPSFRASESVQKVVVKRGGAKKPLAARKASNESDWQCVTYKGKQDNKWCKSAGTIGDWEFQYFGEEDSPCDDCFCCKRRNKPAMKKEKVCAKMGESCLDSQCCQTPGFQCFEKTEYWALCKQWCTPGPDPTDGNGDHWSCKELGPRTEGDAPPPDYTLPAADWVATECAGRGENCTGNMCCKEAGMQCFTKQPGWSSCKPYCNPGPDPTDSDNTHWQCQPLGSRTPGAAPGWDAPASDWVAEKCAAPGQDCSDSKCCQEAGMQCYKKKDGWAMCMPSCQHGPLLTDANPDIWDCTPMGGRTPGLAKAPLEIHVADWVSTSCSADGEDCTKTMCCSNPTSQCYQKNDDWAVCSRGCAPGVHEFDDDQPWSCTGLGPRTPREWQHPSLYCFSVAQIWSPEGDTMRTQINTDGGAGIFACEQYDVFSTDAGVYLGDGPMGAVWSQYFEFAPVGTTIDGTAGNTRLFLNVWEAVRQVGRYANTDWTVKVDPDAVIIPDRLREHLSPHMGRPTYIVTCTLPGMTPMMFGALEAISKDAIQKFFDAKDSCMNLPVDDWGEDRWLGACLNQLGAPGEEDYSMVSDGVCTGVSCGSGAAAFHPFKDAGAWQGCYFEAMR